MFLRLKLAPRFYPTGSTAVAVCMARPDGRPELEVGDFGFSVTFLPAPATAVSADEQFFAWPLAEQARIYADQCERRAAMSANGPGEEAPRLSTA
jgi:hypothetical protein